ncbi:hypothetical protein V6Z11_D05G333700 [Gossypium hirsutum]
MDHFVLDAGFAGLSVVRHFLKESPKDLNLHIDLYEMGIGGGAPGLSGGLLHPYSPNGFSSTPFSLSFYGEVPSAGKNV